MIHKNRIDVYTIHHQRREQLRTLKGEFKPSKTDLEMAKELYFNSGGTVKRLKVTSETRPNVWGDFVKSRIKAS